MSTQTASFRLIDQRGMMAILSKRAVLRVSDIGQTMRFHIQGNGNVVPAMKWIKNADGSRTEKQEQALSASDGSPLYKRIYNVRANSQLAMQNPRNQAILAEAIALESAGDAEAASAKYNEYLNKVQVSFNVIINNNGRDKTFYDGQLAEGEVTLLTTANGQTVVLENVRVVAVAKLGAMPAFTLTDLLGAAAEKDPNDVFTPTQGATAGAAAGA